MKEKSHLQAENYIITTCNEQLVVANIDYNLNIYIGLYS